MGRSDKHKERGRDDRERDTNDAAEKNKESADQDKPAGKKPQGSSGVEILEKGEIFFFYRPKVETEDPQSIDDVQRMYVVMRAKTAFKTEVIKQSHESEKEGLMKGSNKKSGGHGGGSSGGKEGDADSDKAERGGGREEKINIEKQHLYRLVALGRKRLPDASQRTKPYWGYVELVTTSIEDIKKALEPEEYDTVTRGIRRKPAARAAGEGIFCILKHEKGHQKHTHLVYRLELPKKVKDDSPQEELNIEEEASFIIQIKNPNQPSPPNAGLGNKRKATYPASLQSIMGHYRFVPGDPCDFLNYEGCELILISASDNIEKELGLHLDVEHDESCSELVDLFGKKGEIDVKPLLEGEWD